jgi:hypothetical protein
MNQSPEERAEVRADHNAYILQSVIDDMREGWRNSALEHQCIANERQRLIAALDELGELVAWICQADTSQLWTRCGVRPIDPDHPF